MLGSNDEDDVCQHQLTLADLQVTLAHSNRLAGVVSSLSMVNDVNLCH